MIQPAAITRHQAREVDRFAVEEYGISSLVLMENAGRGCFDVLSQIGIRGPVAICCGKGNNGGDGFVIARHLDQAGHATRVLIWSDPTELSRDARVNYEILARAEFPIVLLDNHFAPEQLAAELDACDWIVDALLGTGFSGEPRAPLDRVIRQLNQHPARKLAVDLPSGLDCDTGKPAAATFRADHTCTFVKPKVGLLVESARPLVGQLHTVAIGLPRRLLDELEAPQLDASVP